MIREVAAWKTAGHFMHPSGLAYRFGFLAYHGSDSVDTAAVAGWIVIQLGGFTVHIHPEASFRTVATGAMTALLIGDVFVASGKSTVDATLTRMAVSGNWEAFDDISGRFALLLIENDACRVVNDPFGSRSVYYRSQGGFGVASHASLLAGAFSEDISKAASEFTQMPEYKARGTSYLPGDLTMYESIKALIPNNYYDSVQGRCFRYWPRRSIPGTSIGEFLAECRGYFSRFSAHLAGRYRPVLGVTGGVDTRAVIAGLVGNGLDVQLVTWTAGRLPEEEVGVVAKMVEHLRQPHVYMDPRTRPDSEKFREIKAATKPATGFTRSESSLSANMGELTRRGDVFVRGYGGEIIRGFYNRHRKALSGNMAADFFDMYKTGRIAKPPAGFQKFSMEAIEGFIERANYDAELFNLDLRDLYYWEQRMGTWGANMHNEMDPAVYSITGLNSRPLYAAAFGLAPNGRLGEEIMLEITAMYDRRFAEMSVRS
ncbi:hypothetical protein [Lysobacter sp. F60174L2]|uniref:hypothetical protein n=1 Tax=Lysobacter sp. F60174L2 TaxID=3459295 RepID=UPI00403E3458